MMKRVLAILLLCAASGQAATVTHAVATPDSGNTPNTSGAFTPAANDLLVCFVMTSGTDPTTAASSDLTDSQSLGWTLIDAGQSSAPRQLLCFVANTLAANSSMTVTYQPSDTATNSIICVARVSGMSRTGSSGAAKQFNAANNAAGVAPSANFSASCDTNNPTLGGVANATNPAGLTAPTNWSEAADTGDSSPVTGAEYVYRDSGFTGTSISWASTSASASRALIIELDTSSPPVTGNSNFFMFFP